MVAAAKVALAQDRRDRVMVAEARPGKVMAVAAALLPQRRRSSHQWAMTIYRFRAGNS